MCRNIRTLFNFDPPATEEEVRAAATQFVRKISGFAAPSAANKDAFDRAVGDVSRASSVLLGSLVTNAPPRNRELEAAKSHALGVRRFGPQGRKGHGVKLFERRSHVTYGEVTNGTGFRVEHPEYDRR